MPNSFGRDWHICDKNGRIPTQSDAASLWGTIHFISHLKEWILGDGSSNHLQKIKESSSVIKDCPRCFFLSLKLPNLPLPPIHHSQTGETRSEHRAFSEIGVDMAGPFTIKIGRSLQKRYLMIVACCTSRAINIEVCHSLSSLSCIQALTRLTSKMGRPTYIDSDRGTNFIGTAHHLHEKLEIQKTNGNLWSKTNITWWFNPAAAPTWTGHVEATVKLVKQTLKRLGSQTPYTNKHFLTQIQVTTAVINKCLITVGESQLCPLTSADFLYTGSQDLALHRTS